MIKQAYFRGLTKVAQAQPNRAQKLWRGLTSSSTRSKITRALLAGLPAATVAKLLGLGWGASAAIGAGSAGAAWYAPKLSKRYRLQEAARDAGVPGQMLDRLYYADTDVNGENPLDYIRRGLALNGDQIIRTADHARSVYDSATAQEKFILQTALRDDLDNKRNEIADTPKASASTNTLADVTLDLGTLRVLDVLNGTGRLKPYIDLIKHK